MPSLPLSCFRGKHSCFSSTLGLYTLIALKKNEGGIRPIAVGQTLRRLVCKCAGSRIVQSIGAVLAPS